MSYENAPATKLLATHCACCNRKLVDATSVETGIGPICRGKVGYQDFDAELRAEANKLVYFIAAERVGNDVDAAVARLREMGFDSLAEKIVERLAKAAKKATRINITTDGDRLILVTPFRRNRADEFTKAMRAIPGRRWNGRANTFPNTLEAKLAMWDFLKDFFPGEFGTGPKGVFEIPKAENASEAA